MKRSFLFSIGIVLTGDAAAVEFYTSSRYVGAYGTGYGQTEYATAPWSDWTQTASGATPDPNGWGGASASRQTSSFASNQLAVNESILASVHAAGNAPNAAANATNFFQTSFIVDVTSTFDLTAHHFMGGLVGGPPTFRLASNSGDLVFDWGFGVTAPGASSYQETNFGSELALSGVLAPGLYTLTVAEQMGFVSPTAGYYDSGDKSIIATINFNEVTGPQRDVRVGDSGRTLGLFACALAPLVWLGRAVNRRRRS